MSVLQSHLRGVVDTHYDESYMKMEKLSSTSRFEMVP